MDMHVDGTTDGLDPVHQFSGEDIVLGIVVAVYLHVNRRGNTEIEDLGHDIGRLEEELDTWKTLAAALPESCRYIRCLADGRV